MVQTHQESCEEGTTTPFPSQETEKIWHGSPDPQKVLQLHHRVHPDLLHHHLVLQLLVDIDNPSLTKFCDQYNCCYAICNCDKDDCDDDLQECLETICRRLQKMLGLAQSVQECDNTATLLFNAVMCMRCKPYIDSQRDSCSAHIADI
uniref:Phospholipase A2 domain-containing protein n=1 Tax=Salmo trutta TaxID=8032 RepID=A0A673ZV32_SALTR